MSWSRGSLKRAELARAGSAESKGGSPEKEGRDGEETSERAEQEEGAREGGEGRLMREVRSAVDWKRVNGRMREQHNQPTLAESSAETLRMSRCPLRRCLCVVCRSRAGSLAPDSQLARSRALLPLASA
eukprot:3189830-Rhodomonas_salina.1